MANSPPPTAEPAQAPPTTEPAPDLELADATRDDSSLRRFLHGLSGVDQVGLERRTANLATRSIKKNAKLWAIDTAISMVDLTTLEGADTTGTVQALAIKARRPDPGGLRTVEPSPSSTEAARTEASRTEAPPVAALCVYPDLAAPAVEALAGSGVGVASVATAFPSGRSWRDVKLTEVRQAVTAGATDVDMVIDRGAFLAGRYGEVLDEIRAVRAACGSAHLKVILETGELATYDNVRRASWLALLAGADFIKTSTGKISPAATLPVTHLMLQAVREWKDRTGQLRGVKPAGGLRTTKDALRYLVAVAEVAGTEWLRPELFRFGASSLLNDLLMQRRAQLDGSYASPDHVAVD